MTRLRFLEWTLLSVVMTFSTMAATPVSWQIRNSPSSNPLNGVAYGNGLFVSVGAGTTILSSPDGAAWSAGAAELTSPTLWCATTGNNRFVLGGGEAALMLWSSDGIHWTNTLSTLGTENVHALTYNYGLFVAVGNGANADALILTSSNGVNWIAVAPPTTNRLLAVAAAVGVDGSGWADPLFVAVGTQGTILASTDGATWLPRNSGTTVDLRAVVFHQGRFIAGGDSGTVRTTSDGISWVAAAPAAFNIRGLASSAREVVAVGNYQVSGRLHVSSDGLTWPGTPTQFAQPLNGIAFGAGSFVAVGDGGLIVQSVGATNEWTKPTSGNWEESFWSLGKLPGPDQAMVAFRNPGFKALAIGGNTTANFAGSLSVENLTVDSPAASLNQLLLNYAGLAVPLSVSGDFVLGTNASLVGYYSALQGGRLLLSSAASLSDGCTIAFSNVVVGANAPAQLNLTNVMLAGNLLVVSASGAGTLNQFGGSNVFLNVQVLAGGTCNLASGAFFTDNLNLQPKNNGLAQCNVSSGFMNILGSLRLGQTRFVGSDVVGEFQLTGGSLSCGEIDFLNGTFTQTGGTNRTMKMAIPQLDFASGQYLLSGGTLISSNAILGAVLSPTTPPGTADFVQSGGVHTNTSMVLFGEIRRQAVTHFGVYELEGGLFAADSVRLIGGAFSQTGGTNQTRELVLDEAGSYTLGPGNLITSNTTVDTCCCVMSLFVQNSGRHAIQDRLLLQDFVRYELRGGTLAASHVEIGPGAELRLFDGVISNSALFTFRGGQLTVGSSEAQQLGKLEVIGETVQVCNSLQPAVAALELGAIGTGSVVLHFQDSRDVSWSGVGLSIVHWNGSTDGSGPDHVFVGTNSSALTPTQLSKVIFANPIGFPPGNFPARLSATGEITPAVLPPLKFSVGLGGLVLFWSDNSILESATNVIGPYFPVPGATSPWTNPFAGPQSFFRLHAQ